jgi:predicted NAD/FAD-binding protein
MSGRPGFPLIPASRIAVVGSGIAGLGAARRLTALGHHVTLFEANDYLGGHTHTVDVVLDGVAAPVDTGFLVFNDRTYPNLTRLFAELDVESTPSEMSFSLRNDEDRIEWAGTNFSALFAQPRNAFRPAFWRMLREIARFNGAATRSIAVGAPDSAETLGEHLRRNGYGREFRDWYLIPMAAAIWSSPQADIEDFPFASFARFCANHGLLQITDRPHWRTVTGGGKDYVRRIAAQLRDIRLSSPVKDRKSVV